MVKVFIIIILSNSYALGCQYCNEKAAIQNALIDAYYETTQSTISESTTKSGPTPSGLVPKVTRIGGKSRVIIPCEKFRKKMEEEIERRLHKNSNTFRSFSDFLKR